YGLDVEVANQQRDYREAEANSLTQQREAISGVNIDEELVAMMKFQRAYEASAKVITTSNQMMDVLMGMMR
ncbi:MAG: flagellar basal body rod C-terminal domain-containing protein, partial [Ghiorsea sp.]